MYRGRFCPEFALRRPALACFEISEASIFKNINLYLCIQCQKLCSSCVYCSVLAEWMGSGNGSADGFAKTLAAPRIFRLSDLISD